VLAAAGGVTLLPAPHAARANGIAAISAGDEHTCALTSAGGVKCWGDNTFGELGNSLYWGPCYPGYPCNTTPVDVSGLAGVATVSLGRNHTCALTTAGGVNCWGANVDGELGNGTSSGPELCGYLLPCSTTPVAVSGLADGVAGIAAGYTHTCALTTAGGVKCWGDNNYGELGIGTSSGPQTCTSAVNTDVRSCSTNPVDVSNLGSGVAAISSAGFHTCALTTTGGVKCWGYNVFGQLGDGTTTDRATPVDVSGLGSGVAAISAGLFHTCALTTAGGVKCWGLNLKGELGHGTSTGPDRCSNSGCSRTPVDVSGLASGVASIEVGVWHTCALTTAGGVKCWGDYGNGELGIGTSTGPEVCPGQGYCSTIPVDVSGLTSGVSMIAAGGLYTCALTDTGGVKCWGLNLYNELYAAHPCSKSTDICNAPVDVSGLGPKTTPAPTVGAVASETPTGTAPAPADTPTPTPAGLGDANKDGRVNAIDAALILQYSAGLIASINPNADVNHSGQINAIDSAVILQYSAGLIPGLPA
jgi:alpha-tubulin suppressor-like RCC1 family protein